MAHVVRSELHLVSSVGRHSRWCGHDAGVEHEDVEAGGGGEEYFYSFLNGGEGGEVEFEEVNAGCGYLLFDFVRRGLCFGEVARGEPNLGGVVAREF